MSVRGFKEFAYLVPIDNVGVLEGEGEPTAVTVVRRPNESTVLAQCVEFERVSNEVQRTARRTPPRARWRGRAVEDREATPADAEQWPALKLCLVCAGEDSTDFPNSIEGHVVDGGVGDNHAPSLPSPRTVPGVPHRRVTAK